ncbi:glutamine synthetase [Streptomyces sp. LcepLS]|nr:glutamine synthetase [Streptomyces sp. LcepLS]
MSVTAVRRFGTDNLAWHGSPDPSSNPYLAFSALLLAGLDGIKNKIEPAEPIDKDLYELAPEEHASVPQVPTSLPAVLDALKAGNEYLQADGVFTSNLIETWIDYKRTAVIAPIQLRTHPHEFELYFDIQTAPPRGYRGGFVGHP